MILKWNKKNIIGKWLVENSKYGGNFIKDLVINLKLEFTDGEGDYKKFKIYDKIC